MASKYYYSTRDLLVIAVLAALGGVMSAYVGYLANMVNHLVGVPYGAGQIMGGLHILWMVLIMAITGKKGSGVLGGLVKGFVEFASGSPHGIFIIFLSLVEGLFAELGYWPFRRFGKLRYMTSGGIGAFASVFIAQSLFMINPDLYQGFASFYVFLAVSLLAGISGVVFGGFFTSGIMDSLADAGIVKREEKKEKKNILSFSLPKAFALICGLLIVFSAIYYFALVQSYSDPSTVRVTGDVAYNNNEYYIPAYDDKFITLNAKLDGLYTHKPAQNYTGLPITYILSDARVKGSATKFDVVGSDGYYQTFNLTNVTTKNELILTVQQGPDRIWLIANNYEGGMWVDQVTTIRVY